MEYRYLTEFQSHEPEVRKRWLYLTRALDMQREPLWPRGAQFDYLKSLEIEEKINKIRWCQQGASSAKFLLSTNDKTIKLWKARLPAAPVQHECHG